MNARHAAYALAITVLLAPFAAPVHAQGPAPTAQSPSSPVEKAVFDAVARANAGDFKGGLEILEPYRSDARLLPAGKSLLGYLYVENHRPQDGLAVLEPLTRSEQPDAAVLYNAARAAAALKQPEKARPWLAQAASLDPASPAGRDLGMILARQGQAVEAYTLLRAWVP